MSRIRRLLAGVVLAAVAGIVALIRARRRAREVPLSPILGDSYIGGDWADRRDLRGESVAGEMDSLDAYESESFDPDRVHPDVRALYEQTSEFEMRVDATWYRPFRLGARVASRLTSRVEQLNLPGPGDAAKRVESDLATLAEPAASRDPREAPRLWIRTEPDGTGVFTAIYASYEREDDRRVDIAVPLPSANLSTVLAVHNDDAGIELTTDCPDGGLYLTTPVGAISLPADQRFRVQPAPGEPAAVARQYIRLCGVPLVTIRYDVFRR
ncbi:hypothetical protein [Halosegnis longus]|uniref:Uncharacterized protein n=1 Tax=Halosegnis longus TaxID=2216012 RepID=A0AAJ4R6W4_9EURY|nr:hypothetical protein [Salella cibi]RNJ25365.1 hypothetical protein Nmn1133_00730 [Salella cibi]